MMFKSQLLLVKKSQEHQTFQFWMGDDGDLGTSLEALWGTGWCYPRPGPPCSLLLTKATSTVRASHPILDPARRTVASDRS